MLDASRKLLAVILETDTSIPPNIRSILVALHQGKPLIDDQSPDPIEDQRLIGVIEAASRCNVSRSKFFEVRGQHAELTPIEFGGRVSYSLSLINQLIERLGENALRRRNKKWEVRHVA